jgi:hypothetical protein
MTCRLASRRPGRFRTWAGRGEGWAGIVEANIQEDAAVAEALRTGNLSASDRPSVSAFGPYYAREAAIVPLTQDTIVVLGAPDGDLERNDDKPSPRRERQMNRSSLLEKAKQLADELEPSKRCAGGRRHTLAARRGDDRSRASPQKHS